MSDVRLEAGDTDDGLQKELDDAINAFNFDATGHRDGRELTIAVRDGDGALRAGLYGWTWGGCGYVDLLWVRGEHRGQGLGLRLLGAAEEEIRRRGCDRVALSTHTFQAPAFYA